VVEYLVRIFTDPSQRIRITSKKKDITRDTGWGIIAQRLGEAPPKTKFSVFRIVPELGTTKVRVIFNTLYIDTLERITVFGCATPRSEEGVEWYYSFFTPCSKARSGPLYVPYPYITLSYIEISRTCGRSGEFSYVKGGALLVWDKDYTTPLVHLDQEGRKIRTFGKQDLLVKYFGKDYAVNFLKTLAHNVAKSPASFALEPKTEIPIRVRYEKVHEGVTP